MAKPIEPTPTLSGKDAEILMRELDSSIYDESKAKFLDKCRKTYEMTKK